MVKVAILFAILIIASIIDIKYKVIYEGVTLLGILLAFNYHLFCGDVFLSIMGVNTGIVIVWVMNCLKWHNVGGGDAKLMATVGAFLGWIPVVFVAFGAWILCRIFRIFHRQRAVPYAPFIGIATLLVVLWNAILYYRM